MKWGMSIMREMKSIMTEDRYNSLSNDEPPPNLTQAEWDAGWHFCVEWDNLLIGPGMGELAACSCFAATDPRNKLCIDAREQEVNQILDGSFLDDGPIGLDNSPQP